ncbi:hypothetical protein ACFL1R_00695 [Candidatus Latescibacterota bacterium]
MKNASNNPEHLYEISNHPELKPLPFYHTDLKNTLETIVSKEKPEKIRLVEKLFSDKSKTSKATVKALLNEIELRENLDSHLLGSINEDI